MESLESSKDIDMEIMIVYVLMFSGVGLSKQLVVNCYLPTAIGSII